MVMATCKVCLTVGEGVQCPRCGAPRGGDSDVAGALPVGTPLHGGDFVVGQVLGAGGFGITYAGADRTLQRLVAIKEFFPQGSHRGGTDVMPGPGLSPKTFEAARERFLHEARVAAGFDHRNIVHVFALFEENGTAYMVMERLFGRTLLTMLEESGPIAETKLLPLAAQAAEGLRVVHAAGYVHRDVKSDNLFLTDDGRLVLLDFGTVKAQTTTKQAVTALVSPGYAPPEQYHSAYAPEPGGDVYALAATMYELLTGTTPPEAPARAMGQPLVAPRDIVGVISSAVSQAIVEALDLNVARRPSTVDAFITKLGAVSPAPAAPRQDAPPSSEGTPALSLRNRLRGHQGMVRALAFSPDGRWLLSGAEDRRARLWNIAAGEAAGTIVETDGWVTGVLISPDGRRAVVLSHDKTIRIADLEQRASTTQARGPGPGCGVTRVGDGTRVAAAFRDGTLALFDLDANELARTRVGAEDPRELTASPDGSRLAYAAGSEPCVRLHDSETLRETGRIALPEGGVRALAWSSDGTRIAVSTSGRTIRIHGAADGRLPIVLEGHQGRVNALAFHPHRPLLASGGSDKTVRLWSPVSGACLQTLTPHEGEVLTLAWSRDGNLLASGSQDERICVFEVSP